MKAVRYVGKGDKLPKVYLESLAADSGYTIVNSVPGGANVTLRLEMDSHPLEISHEPLTRDFLDLATLVYIVDEIEQRGDDWTREFDIIFPVKNPKLWTANQIALSQTLETLVTNIALPGATGQLWTDSELIVCICQLVLTLSACSRGE
jgi:hypothetical protein